MFANPILIGVVCGTGFVLGMIMPLAGLTVLAGYLMVLMFMIQGSRLDIFLAPLGKHEIINLFITKSRKIIPEIVKEDEGYIKRKTWGRFRVMAETNHQMGGKTVVITGEGIPHTLRMDHAKVAMLLARAGIKTKADLEKFLNVKIEDSSEGNHDDKKREKQPREGTTGRTRKDKESEIPEV